MSPPGFVGVGMRPRDATSRSLQRCDFRLRRGASSIPLRDPTVPSLPVDAGVVVEPVRKSASCRSAKRNGHGPYRYLADVPERLPTQPASQLDELLPHHRQPRR